ncbi:MAG: zinc ribbon domain-containing protein [Candidatus Lokiarchaeota archaeon]|nr:zinc ribbon domain-containing protein [Candidatus Lokiarchaeota archaeon]
MIKLIVKIEGTIKNYTKSYSGNTAFIIIDKNNHSHYCYSTNYSRIGDASDNVIVIGVRNKYGDKIRVEYAENLTKNRRYIKRRKSNTLYTISILFVLISILIMVVSTFVLIDSDISDPSNQEQILKFVIGIMGLVGTLVSLIPLLPIIYYQKKTLNLQRHIYSLLEKEGKKVTVDDYIQSKKINPNINAQDLNVNDFIPSKDLENRPNAKFCPTCGQNLMPNIKFCSACGTKS